MNVSVNYIYKPLAQLSDNRNLNFEQLLTSITKSNRICVDDTM